MKDVYHTQGLYVTPYLALVGVAYFAIILFIPENILNEKESKDSKKMKRDEKKKNENKSASQNIQNQLKDKTIMPDAMETISTVDDCKTFESKIYKSEIKHTPFILVLIYIFYFLIFHNLANLPLGDKLLFGVHQRFWMQPNVLLFIIAGVGFDILSGIMINGCVNMWENTNTFLNKNENKNEIKATKKYRIFDFIVIILTNIIAIVIIRKQLDKWYVYDMHVHYTLLFHICIYVY